MMPSPEEILYLVDSNELSNIYSMGESLSSAMTEDQVDKMYPMGLDRNGQAG